MAKTEINRQHIEAGLKILISLKGQGSNRDLFKQLYDREPTSQSELNAFTNRIRVGRGNPGLDFLGLFVEKYPELRDMTLGEFLGINDEQ